MKRQSAKKSPNGAETALHAVLHTMQSIGEPAALIDLRGGIQDLTPAFSALCGYSSDKLRKLDIHDVIENLGYLPEQGKVENTIADTVTESAREIAFPEPLAVKTKGGALRWVIPNISNVSGTDGQLAARLLVLRDITGFMQARLESDSNERKYRELVENANICILRIKPDFTICFINEFALNFFGYTDNELIGKNLLQTLIPSHDPSGKDLHGAMHQMVETPELHSGFDLLNRCKDGRMVWVQWSVRALRNERGGVKELLCIGADITRRKQAETEADLFHERSRRLADRLVVSEEEERARLATYLHDEIIQMLSLSTIRLGGIEEQFREIDCEDAAKRVQGIRNLLNDATSRCRSMMDQLVPSLLYEIGLGAALRHLAERHCRLDGREIEVEDQMQGTSLPPALSALLFRSARELLMNALKYAGTCRIRISLTTENGMLKLHVDDDGCGFDVDDPSAIYDENGGFGLFDIRERLEGFDGKLLIKSQPGKGTSACVVIPLSVIPAK